MTIEGMNEAIQKYCEHHAGVGECKACAIDSICTPILGSFLDHEDACEEAYDIITNLPCDKPDNVNHPSHYNQGKFEFFNYLTICNIMLHFVL